MKLRTGIVGLPNVGKSTLFNALTGGESAQAANYPFCTIEPNTGIVDLESVPKSEVLGAADRSKEKVIRVKADSRLRELMQIGHVSRIDKTCRNSIFMNTAVL